MLCSPRPASTTTAEVSRRPPPLLPYFPCQRECTCALTHAQARAYAKKDPANGRCFSHLWLPLCDDPLRFWGFALVHQTTWSSVPPAVATTAWDA
eukprot:1192938-Prorocentrum_minimum.AAC.2